MKYFEKTAISTKYITRALKADMQRGGDWASKRERAKKLNRRAEKLDLDRTFRDSYKDPLYKTIDDLPKGADEFINLRKFVNQGLNKKAVFGVTPWDVKSPEELDSIEGYARERGNMIAGQLTGGLTGGALGAAAGEAGLGKKVNPKFVAKLPNKSNTLFLALLGALGGAWTGGVRSLRKTEREAGVEPTGPGKYFARVGGTAAGSVTVPIWGAPMGDYAVSRHLQDYKRTKPKKKDD